MASQEVEPPRDQGSAVVEFVLVSVLVIALALGVIQLALALHVRSMLTSAAAEGARVAASYDREQRDGIVRSDEVVTAALGDYPRQIDVGEALVGGQPVVEVTISGPMPIVGLWGIGTLTATGRALKETDREPHAAP